MAGHGGGGKHRNHRSRGPGMVGPDRCCGCLRLGGHGVGREGLCSRMKHLHRQLEFVDIQEEYIKDEQKNPKWELLRAQEEVRCIQSVPLVTGQFSEMVDQDNAIVGSTTGFNYHFRILSIINKDLPAEAVLVSVAASPLQCIG